MVSPQPLETLLAKIEEIASIKRGLSRKERALSSGGLYVWANDLPDGRTLVRAGSFSVFAKLISHVHSDERKEVKKYRPGERWRSWRT
jgi:hypothetical protein